MKKDIPHSNTYPCHKGGERGAQTGQRGPGILKEREMSVVYRSMYETKHTTFVSTCGKQIID